MATEQEISAAQALLAACEAADVAALALREACDAVDAAEQAVRHAQITGSNRVATFGKAGQAGLAAYAHQIVDDRRPDLKSTADLCRYAWSELLPEEDLI